VIGTPAMLWQGSMKPNSTGEAAPDNAVDGCA
jgi:hypothetical protein